MVEHLEVELFVVVMSREQARRVLEVSEPLAEKIGIVELEDGAFQHSSRKHLGQEAENVEKAREQIVAGEVLGLQVETEQSLVEQRL